MTPEDLVEIHRIQQLKHRYMRGVDQKDWDLVESCFLPDASASYGGGAYVFDSRDGIMGFLRESMGSTNMLTSHRVSQPEIVLGAAGPGTATGTWALHDIVVHLDFGVQIQGAAFYEDRYALDGGEWRIAHTGYKRTYEELFPRASIDGLRITAHRWETDGRSKLG
jgi:hypothetical protein